MRSGAEYASAIKGWCTTTQRQQFHEVFIEPLSVFGGQQRAAQLLEKRSNGAKWAHLRMLGVCWAASAKRIGYSLRALTELDVCFAKAGWEPRASSECNPI